jgi:hypothetical protein
MTIQNPALPRLITAAEACPAIDTHRPADCTLSADPGRSSSAMNEQCFDLATLGGTKPLTR